MTLGQRIAYPTDRFALIVCPPAVLLADYGDLLAGDMLSDVFIPLLDPRRPDQVGAYETALDGLGEAARSVDVLVLGHGAVAKSPEIAARLAADHAYIDALRKASRSTSVWVKTGFPAPPVEPGAGPTLIRMKHRAWFLPW